MEYVLINTQWEERYMQKLIGEYISLLSEDREASYRLQELDRRMCRDKKRLSLDYTMSRSNMELNLLDLVTSGVITPDDLDGFSDELRERIVFLLRSFGRL